MAPTEPGKIRNVAVVGHRGTGKTSLVEALLYQTGEMNRLGSIEAGSTVGDWDEDEQKRQMSIALTLTHTTWQGRKINLVDVPGDPSFQGESRCALRVVEGALVVVNGVMGLEVGTARVKKLADELGLARVLFVSMLDRERADFFRTLAQIQEQFSSKCVAVHLPIGSEHGLTGIVDVLHMCAYMSPDGGIEGEPVAIPAEMADLAQEYREKLLDEVVETDEALMEQYLEGEELDSHAVAAALKLAITRGEVFPVACGVATKNLGTHALLDLIVEGVPSPAKRGADRDRRGRDCGVRVQDARRSVRRADQLFRVFTGHGHRRLDTRRRAWACQGADGHAAAAPGQGPHRREGVRRGRHRRRREAQGRADRRSADRPRDQRRAARDRFPEPVMSFAITPKTKGDEEKVATAIRRLAEEDPTLRLRRDQQTGEEILSGMSQMHVEVALERAKRRFGVDIELHPPRVPVPRDDPLGGARPRALQEADRRAGTVRRLPHRDRADRGRRRLRVRRPDRRRRDPAELPACRRQGNPGGDGAR